MLTPNFYVLPVLSSQLSVFSKLCIMNTRLHFLLLLFQLCRSLRNIPFGARILGKSSDYHGWLSMMTSSEGPLFSLASGPPNPKPTTACMKDVSNRTPALDQKLVQPERFLFLVGLWLHQAKNRSISA